MTKSELINSLCKKLVRIPRNDVNMATNLILKAMATRLVEKERIEIRGFGSFSLRYRPWKIGRNPKSGEAVEIPGKYVPHFKPGTGMRERVDGKV